MRLNYPNKTMYEFMKEANPFKRIYMIEVGQDLLTEYNCTL